MAVALLPSDTATVNGMPLPGTSAGLPATAVRGGDACQGSVKSIGFDRTLLSGRIA